MTFARSWSVGVELSVRCARCNYNVPVNGPCEQTRCKGCGHSLALARDLWEHLLEGPAARGRLMRDGQSFDMTIHTAGSVLSVRMYREKPPCPHCSARFGPGALAPGAEPPCPACGKPLPAAAPSDLVRRAVLDLDRVIGAAATPDAAAAAPARWWLHFAIREEANRRAQARAAAAVAELERALAAAGLSAPPWPPPGARPYRSAADLRGQPERAPEPEPAPEPTPAPEPERPLLEIDPLPVQVDPSSPYRGRPLRPEAGPAKETTAPAATGVSHGVIALLVAIAFIAGVAAGAAWF